MCQTLIDCLTGCADTSSTLVIISGLLTLVWSFVMYIYSRKIPELKPDKAANPLGFKSRIMWLELINNEEELLTIMGIPKPETGKKICNIEEEIRKCKEEIRIIIEEIRNTMGRVNFLDYFFSVFYSLLFASLFNFADQLTTSAYKPFFVSGLILCLVMFLTDILEDVQIGRLLNASSVCDKCGIFCLQCWARFKWIAISLACIIISILYFSFFWKVTGSAWNYIWLIIPVLFLISGFSILLSISLPSERSYIEKASTIGLGGSWIASLVYVIFLTVKPLLNDLL